MRAALAMQAALERFNVEINRIEDSVLALRIGIETGEVVTGLRDVNGIREYTAIGDAVNVAARLPRPPEPRTIIIGPGAERHVRRFFSLNPVKPLHLKGKSEPLSAWLVNSSSPQSASPQQVEISPFVGEARETSMFMDRLDELRRGRGQLIAVIGDPRLGKSRLLAEARSAASDIPWRRAVAFAHEDSTSYALIRSLLTQFCSKNDADQSDLNPAILATLDRLGFANEIPLIARVLGLTSLSPSLDVDSTLTAAEAVEVTNAFFQMLLKCAGNNRLSSKSTISTGPIRVGANAVRDPRCH